MGRKNGTRMGMGFDTRVGKGELDLAQVGSFSPPIAKLPKASDITREALALLREDVDLPRQIRRRTARLVESWGKTSSAMEAEEFWAQSPADQFRVFRDHYAQGAGVLAYCGFSDLVSRVERDDELGSLFTPLRHQVVECAAGILVPVAGSIERLIKVEGAWK